MLNITQIIIVYGFYNQINDSGEHLSKNMNGDIKKNS